MQCTLHIDCGDCAVLVYLQSTLYSLCSLCAGYTVSILRVHCSYTPLRSGIVSRSQIYSYQCTGTFITQNTVILVSAQQSDVVPTVTKSYASGVSVLLLIL